MKTKTNVTHATKFSKQLPVSRRLRLMSVSSVFTTVFRRAACLTVAFGIFLPLQMSHAATLVGHWDFAGNLQDSSPTGANGTMYDLVHIDGGSKTETPTTPTYSTGPAGQALSIDSFVTPDAGGDIYSGQVIRAGEHDAYDFGSSTDFSLAGRVYWGGDNGMAYQTIFAQKQSRATSRAGFMVSIEPLGTVTLRLAGTGTHFQLSSSAIDEEAWYHFAVTVDRDGDAQMYINGVPDGAASSVAAVGDISSTGVDLTVGASGFANQKGYFNGQLDDLRVYNGLLTSTEIAALAVIPEPSTLVLGLIALGGLLLHSTGRRFLT